MWRQRDELESLGLGVLLVSFEPLERLRLYTVEDGFGWPVLRDEGRTGYVAYGLERAGFARTWLSPRTVWFYLKAALRGRKIRRPVSDSGQLGGDFLIDPGGRIAWQFRSADPADRPPVSTILRTLHELRERPSRA